MNVLYSFIQQLFVGHPYVPDTVLGSRNLGVYQSLSLLSRNSLFRGKDRPATNMSGSDGMMAWGCHPGSREEP